MAQMYSVTFNAVAVTALQDFFELNVGSGCAVVIHGVFIGNGSDAGDAQDEQLSIKMNRGHATSGSGGSAATPAALAAGLAAANSTAEVNNTTIASTGTEVILHSDTFNVRAGYQYIPTPEARIVLPPSARFCVRLFTTAPVDSITMNGTLIFEELK